ncbi:Lysine-specific demethylase 4D [Frankliniella fusca]|uniref:Lysine-specific demethylase 4D n=1 Tax=Frankliniella fusca TaxID=407009 RepID=A0AAE1GVX7_9NEOP|nr:Lysine-specific demethylase 4D [Frankliniella fusca]KAK3913723.1 Lysine-specific demethylase 4D [Frankliniella fusca]KAK3914702.1 Lysine-specific demethylase 4D [Frankliniella fusca]KAK3916912.1 Lysine-specific demethylase 4D [Frankliniella fusca]KAK3920407.1 Lysine-specific demethylase 4D [Frankliniella fusca]
MKYFETICVLISHNSTHCSMQALEHGNDDFLQHFFNKVTCNPKMLERSCRDDLSCIRNRAVANSIAYQKRQSYDKATTMEGKKRSLTMAMLSEEIVESSHSQCLCDSCNTKFTYKNATKTFSAIEDNVSLYSAGIEESRNNYLHLTNNFAMAYLCYKNMLSSLNSVFNGVSYPALYQGGLHSVFPMHTEDLSCWSFNFVLHGFPKFWLMVPPTSVCRLTDALQRRGFNGLHRWCRNILNHKFYIPTPEFFREENIPFELVIQQQGEGIVILPNTAHTGGNLGPNLAEACNFGSHKWIPYGCVSPNCPCMDDAVHADLSDIVAVHEPSLLKAYIDNDIVNVVEDQYFQKSILVPKKDLSCGSTSSQPIDHVGFSSEGKKSQANNSRIKCPVCEVSWSYVQKGNMVTHLVKHHKSRIEEKVVTKFIKQYSLTIKK